ncbi:MULTISPECIES: DUF6757 family protein [Halobacterium]|uniref:Uncharacterized protein n=4 Tax=Halobacterium salinarum TaxID=2242 RepID=A0A510N9I9_HALSA|nr:MULTISPECIES: DUF6757 family protein [Halobacterium]MBB6089505.1 hypothetical protein [Halobacterium salinarum]MCF2164255.1 hypothetical protein [Halobacterium salinarum]MCF2167042.1 hypothetical protein [Halobacterium salinarum]MCF2207238.1 hypothetical protein [Halobacterium salinarum]MCF2239793.1 hypothetical protein [Halobacterium salinarum]
MQCHYCDRDADLTVEKSGLKVGVCEQHFQQRLEDISDSDALQQLRDQLEIERS